MLIAPDPIPTRCIDIFDLSHVTRPWNQHAKLQIITQNMSIDLDINMRKTNYTKYSCLFFLVSARHLLLSCHTHVDSLTNRTRKNKISFTYMSLVIRTDMCLMQNLFFACLSLFPRTCDDTYWFKPRVY